MVDRLSRQLAAGSSRRGFGSFVALGLSFPAAVDAKRGVCRSGLWTMSDRTTKHLHFASAPHAIASSTAATARWIRTVAGQQARRPTARSHSPFACEMSLSLAAHITRAQCRLVRPSPHHPTTSSARRVPPGMSRRMPTSVSRCGSGWFDTDFGNPANCCQYRYQGQGAPCKRPVLHCLRQILQRDQALLRWQYVPWFRGLSVAVEDERQDARAWGTGETGPSMPRQKLAATPRSKPLRRR